MSGVVVTNFTLPFIDPVDLGTLAEPLTIFGIVAVINVVNLTDGVDGLAAGVCFIGAGTFAAIALSLDRDAAGILAACTAGAAFGFLFHNFHPASIFMGDAGFESPRLPACLHRDPGSAEDRGGGRVVLPAGDPRRADPGYRICRREADQIREADLCRRPMAFPSPVCEHRVFAASDGFVFVCVDFVSRGACFGAAIHSVQRRPRQPRHGLDVGACADGRARAGRKLLSRGRARNPEIPSLHIPSPGGGGRAAGAPPPTSEEVDAEVAAHLATGEFPAIERD